MKLQAKVKCDYENKRVSRAVALALTPDNLQLPKGLKISTKARGHQVVSEIELDGKIETLLATLDDILACTVTAESMF